MRFFDRHKMPEFGPIQTAVLFQEMEENRGSEHPIEHTLEIMSAARSGSITQSGFNLYGYDYRCKMNEHLNRLQHYSKEVSLIEENPSDETYVPGTVTTAKVPHREDGFAISEDRMAFSQTFDYLHKNRQEIQKRTSCDPMFLLLGALNQEPSAISSIRDISAEDPDFGEVIYDLISSGIAQLREALENLLGIESYLVVEED